MPTLNLQSFRLLKLCTLAVLALAVVGTVGVHYIEHWSWFDSLYMVVITLSTIGYQEVHELSHRGRIFNLGLIVAGVALMFVMIGALTQALLEFELIKVFGRRRMQREVASLKDHYIICGAGRVGMSVAHELARNPCPFVIIENDEKIAAGMDPRWLVHIGDAASEKTLREAGIEHALGMVAAASTDATNIYVVLTARGLNPRLKIIARASEERAEKHLRTAGADVVISPYSSAGHRIAQSFIRPKVLDFLDLATSRSGSLEMIIEEIRIGQGSPLSTATVGSSGVHHRFGIMILAIRRSDGETRFNPKAEDSIRAGDYLIAMGEPQQLAKLEKSGRIRIGIVKIVTAAEMREIDRLTTEKYGVPSLTLMENAGSAVADFAQKHFEFNSVCVVCGKGNNGGDGFVAARKLSEAGKEVSVIILANAAGDLRGDAAEMFKKLSIAPLWISQEKDFEKAEVQGALNADLIVDAILGTGFIPPVKGIAAKAISLINLATGWVLAVDVPSGVSADAGEANAAGDFIVADGVITFTAPKPIHVFGRPTEGPMAVVEIGSPAELVLEQARGREDVFSIGELAQAFPSRSPDAHKGEFGHVVVIGGSVGKAGAAAMAGMAALAAGAGLVTVASAKSVQPTIAGFAPELMTVALPETSAGSLAMAAFPELQELIAEKDCLAIGPGLSRNPETAGLVRKLVASTRVPVVLDADGLNAFSEHVTELSGTLGEGEAKFKRTLVLTPHPGEMSRLLGSVGTAQVEGDRLNVARTFARDHDLMLVLKGHRTLIASPDGSAVVNVTGNPGMAKGGSGDVLTGIVAALVARYSGQGMLGISFGHDVSPEGLEVASMFQKFHETHDQELGMALWKKARPRVDSARVQLHSLFVAIAVGLHGLAGDLARELHGEYSMSATQIIQSIGSAITLIQRDKDSRFAYLQR